MRPQWRLAISSLSERRSRTALLAATVALSAALIAAVSCAMNSMQVSVRAQADTLVGTADARIKPTGSGQTLDPGLLTQVRAWPGVLRAEARAQVPLTVSVRLPALVRAESGGFERGERRLSRSAMAYGSTSLDRDASLVLAAGRLPSSSAEVVIDASLADELSLAGAERGPATGLFPRRNAIPHALAGPRPNLPMHVDDEPSARALNAQVGVRIADTIEVVRQALPPINVSAAIKDPLKAAELARQAGATLKPDLVSGLFRKPVPVTVVGIASPPPLGGRPRLFATVETVASLSDTAGRFADIDVWLAPGTHADEFVASHRSRLHEHTLLQTSSKVTSGLDRNIQASRLGFILATVMAFFAAGFIITTAMSTGITERTRELGILRCIGASPRQLASSQLLAGCIVGGIGAALGVPLGVALAAALVHFLREQIDVSLHAPWWGLTLAGGGALLCGVLGAAFPAWQASRVTPLEALAARARAPRAAHIASLLALAAAALAVQLAVVTLTRDGQSRFWLYVFLGLPCLFVGYFSLSVPVILAVATIGAGLVSKLLRLPARLLAQTVRATPYRFGFTAGSMMLGLAFMVEIWTQGGAIQRDWLGKLDFPDAFVTGLNLSAESQRTISALPFVRATCAITMHAVETNTFGVKALQSYKSTFLAFEPRAFFDMTHPLFVQGDEATAIRRLEEGGAVIVAREFQVARGLGLGDRFRCQGADASEHEFEIVGVVTSPGLELVSQFFNIGEDFTEQSLHAVFGSRKDLKEKFGSDAIHLIQIALRPGTDDADAVRQIRDALEGAGILDAGSGKWVKERIVEFIHGALFAFSCVALLSMLIAGFGVANLIIAGIHARQFEFGVLRAIGAARGLVVRLVAAEAVLVALAAAVLGTVMGTQGIFAIQQIDRLLFGLTLRLRPPPLPIGIGWGATILITLAAAAPAIVWLSRRKPRELLGAVRG